jgi:hypothetical protein
MVLSSETAKSIIKKRGDGKIWDIMFLGVDHLSHPSDITKLDWAIEILNNIAMLSKANQLSADLGAGLKMDIKILSEAIESIYSNTHFNDAQLTRFFELQQKIERFSTIMADWHDMERYFLPYQAEYFLLGMPFDLASNDNINNALSGKYDYASIDMTYGRIEISDFIEQAKEMISEQVENRK